MTKKQQQQQQGSHVPKFGSWDQDNIPYTAYFENARKEKSGNNSVIINPNDPEQNPQAFNLLMHPPNAAAEKMEHRRKSSIPSEDSSSPSNSAHHKSNSDHSLMLHGSHRQHHHQRQKSDLDKSIVSVSAASHPRPPVPSSSSSDHSVQRVMPSASVPKFGAWDETDPRSAEGFTILFNRVKEEKQISSLQPPVFNANSQANKNATLPPTYASKLCCCCSIFSRGNA